MKRIELIINRQKNRIERVIPLNLFTIPRVYIPKSLKNKPGNYVVKPNEQIMIIWSHWNPEKGKKTEIKRSKGIQDWKTLKEQKEWAKTMREAYHALLIEGFDPFAKETDLIVIDFDLLTKDLTEALKMREGIIGSLTYSDYNRSLNLFLEWINSTVHKKILTTSKDLGKVMDLFFKDLRNKNTNPTYYNNIRSNLSAIFKELIKQRILIANPIAVIDKLKNDPVKNRPFNDLQIKNNTEWLEKNDPGLLFFLRVMAYTFLRPKEVMRIKCGNIDFSRNLISVKTKSTVTEHIPMVDKLREILMDKKVHLAPTDADLIHFSGDPQIWEATLPHKQRLFGKRFVKLREALLYPDYYTIYSYRHTMAVKVYDSFKEENLNHDEIVLKMKEVTRHKSIGGLKNYLRGIGATTVKDYGHRLDLDI